MSDYCEGNDVAELAKAEGHNEKIVNAIIYRAGVIQGYAGAARYKNENAKLRAKLAALQGEEASAE